MPGRLTLYSPGGSELLHELPCLGKAENARAAAHDNHDRDPLKPYGDTPLGRYNGKLELFDPPHAVLGSAWIRLDPKSGDAMRARDNGRRGLGIHAGRGDKKLIPTFGCIRLSDKDFALLVEELQCFDASQPVEVLIV